MRKLFNLIKDWVVTVSVLFCVVNVGLFGFTYVDNPRDGSMFSASEALLIVSLVFWWVYPIVAAIWIIMIRIFRFMRTHSVTERIA